MQPEKPVALPRSASLNRIASLDGLRALSILLVVCLHTLQRFSQTHAVSSFWFGLFNGESGVFIFFEISGFLITSLLLEEHRKRGSVSLRGFYLRRAFRILPPLYLYIAVAVLLGLAGRLALSWGSVWSAMFFYHNLYDPGNMWSLEHLWSISIEEQFYLVWPFVLVFCLRRPGLHGRMRAAVMPAVVVAASPVARMVLGRMSNHTAHFLAVHLLRFDFIMFGCLVALLQHTLRFEAFYRRATRFWWIPPSVMLLCSFAQIRYQNYFDLTIGYTVNGVAIAMFLLWSTRNADSMVGKVLNFGPIAWIGVLSYSIYLWQTLWLHAGNEAALRPISWAGRPPLNWLGFMACAIGSYYLVERPSLRLRGVLIKRLQVYRRNRARRTTAAS